MKIIEGFRLRDVMGQATIIGEGTAQINFNKLITLNESAAYLWRSVEGREFDAEVLAALLVDKYAVSEETAAADAAAVLAKWTEIGLVQE